MAALVTRIEERISTVLQGIDGTLQSSGYTYKTKTGTVEIDDEASNVASDRNKGETGLIHYTIEQSPEEENIEWGDSNCVLTNQIIYKVTAKVKNTTATRTPKRDAKKRCADVLADMKYAFGFDNTLDGLANWIKYDRSERIFLDTGDKIRAANLEVYFEVNYGQQFNNPDEPANN